MKLASGTYHNCSMLQTKLIAMVVDYHMKDTVAPRGEGGLPLNRMT